MTSDGNFFRNSEMISFRIFPIDEPDSLRILPDVRFHLYPVAQQVIDRSIDVVEAARLIACHFVQLEQGSIDQCVGAPLNVLQEWTQIGVFNVAIAGALIPIAEVIIAELIAKQRDDARLGLFLDFATTKSKDFKLPLVFVKWASKECYPAGFLRSERHGGPCSSWLMRALQHPFPGHRW